MVDRFGLRKLETIFAVLISIMAVTFGFEVNNLFHAIDFVVKGIF